MAEFGVAGRRRGPLGAGRRVTGARGRQGPAGLSSQRCLTVELFVICFVRILDDNPITRISQQLFTGLHSLFFL